MLSAPSTVGCAAKFINTAIGFPLATESTRITATSGSTGPLGGHVDLKREIPRASPAPSAIRAGLRVLFAAMIASAVRCS
jgi:hypothetical protein